MAQSKTEAAIYLLPDFELYLSTGIKLTSLEFPAVKVGYKSAYTQAFETKIYASGDLAYQLLDSGYLTAGIKIDRLVGGYRDEYKTICKDLLIWTVDWDGSSSDGDSFVWTAYGCSQYLRQSGQVTAKLKGKTVQDCAIEIAKRHGLKIWVGQNAYSAAVEDKTITPPTTPSGDAETSKETPAVAPNISDGYTTDGSQAVLQQADAATTAAEEAAKKKRTEVIQSGKTDWDFLTELGKQVGYTLSETDDGQALYFGPGIEVGNRPRWQMVRGTYTYSQAGRTYEDKSNIERISGSLSLYGLPSEIIVTGIENGVKFELIVTPEDLADKQKITLQSTPAQGTNIGQNDISAGYAGTDVIALLEGGSANIDSTKKPKKKSLGAGNFAGKLVGQILKGAYPGNRKIVGGASNKLDALSRGLEGLALTNLRFQQLSISTTGFPGIKAGHEVVLLGDKIPGLFEGLYLVREVSGEIGADGGNTMEITICRNST